MSLSSNPCGLSRRRDRADGGTLLVALSTIAALSVIAGGLALSLTRRTQTAARAASWHEALVAAESSTDLAVAEIRRVLPATIGAPSSAWSGWTSSTGVLPVAKQIPTGLVLSCAPPPLVHGGEGNTTTTALVTVEAPVGFVYPLGSSYSWLRVRGVGTATLPGHRQAALTKFDTALRHYAFARERSDIVGRPNRAVATPEVSRAVEVIVRPVLPFEQALLSVGAFSGTNTSSFVDSFDSTNLTKSTSGLYDSNKQQKNGSAYTLGTSFTFAGKIYGDAGTSGGTLTKTASISGNVNNSFYQAPVPIATPPWGATASTTNSHSSNATSNLTAGLSASSPARYQIGSTSGKLNISGDPLLPTYIEIYVTGDLSGKLSIPAGVQVSIYAAGSVQLDAADIDNRNNRASSLQIYGIQPAAGASPSVSFNLGKDLYASVYAPGHALHVTGSGQVIGALVAKSVDISAAMQLHYDEVLARGVGPVIDYKAASWIEDVR